MIPDDEIREMAAELTRLRGVVGECQCWCHESGESHNVIRRHLVNLRRWVRWMLFKVDPGARELLERALRGEKPPEGA